MDRDDVAGPDPVRGLDRPAVDPHAFGIDHFLEDLAGVVGEPAGEVRIDPLPFDARLDFKFQGRFGKRRGPHESHSRSGFRPDSQAEA